MALNTGLAAQLGYAQETTWGTAVTTNMRFVPLVDESLATEIEFLESEGIIAGAQIIRTQQWSRGLFRSEGDVGLEVYDRTIGLLLVHALGSVTTTGTTAPFTHTITPGDLYGRGLTFQVGRPDRNGTVHPFTYAGTKIQSWELAVVAGEIATLGLTVVAKTETTVTALQTATYTQSIAPMTFVNGSFTLNTSSLCVRQATISGENQLTTDRVCIGQSTIDEPTTTDRREFMGEIELEFPNLVHYNRFLAGTEGNLTLVLANQLSAPNTSTLTISMNVRTEGSTPNVGGRDMLVQTMNFKATGTNSDASAITVTFQCADSTP